MNPMKRASILLLLPSLALAGKYDPGEDRAALRRHASAAYDAAASAAGRPLEPQKAAVIKADLDESLAQARLAAESAKSLETAASLRADEMDNILKGKIGPLPEGAAKDLGDAAAAGRARWKTLTKDREELRRKVDALPDQKPDGKPNEEKARMKGDLDRAGAALDGADAALTAAESGAAVMTDAAARLKDARRRSLGPAGERKAADAEAAGVADDLPPPVAEAKAAVDLLDQEPKSVNRTRAGDKLGVPRELTRRLYAAADRACNRDGDFVGLSGAFDRARTAFEDARQAAGGKPDAAKALMDQAEAVQTDVHARLGRN
jgi:hypothetical protein